ncbi:bifunctional 4-hydroxy-2-oxoglutarate aldolase/2-dehydro-3-deoxy-phosphogluconate aldolase [Microbacterium sp. CFBP9034]|uniref:bifunctional 4-hydroxy-2-oxoglutarate aldolase/2-dehydro-3-deoxy-phosphogluconate aldolase n=1 Tax=Microbacterium sp. CFBP9034 TaxID=3096540 RepID=UPI002A6B4A72|nr:bifunctional 4-hydroxy-2-oxoglutarate aldolase/2-dehydro-3-deoxy-phosphogluconate aldolase [Microbacterium sp. CFBP9034]MDY0908210.1 bifunctional 4-hydroxy-2-oxoglutarate aldolase/2-dehydro-3-deoxy-phosphogluconate aldolase [Microbacterium sp. CFBP9034]
MSAVAEVTRIGIVPVVVIDDPGRAHALAEALLAGGIGCAEFTLRTPAGIAALRAAAAVPGFLAGAGTVLTVDQAKAAADAGAAFAVSPGYDPAVAGAVAGHGVTMIPGVATPTEVQRAFGDGFAHVKVFPAGLLGGPAYLDALAAPFREVAFLPSGGVAPDDVGPYLRRPHVFAVSGSWMVPRAAIADGDFDLISTRSRAAAEARDAARAGS